MNILGIDTSTAVTSACVLRDTGETFELVPDPSRLDAKPAHARETLPTVTGVLARAELRPDELDAVAVGVGPGAFTGLRIGVATARALASAWSLALRPVSSLAALAAGAGDAGDEIVLAAIDARRGEVFAALHRGREPRWPPFLVAPTELGEHIGRADVAPVAVGNGAVRFRGVLESAGARVPADDSELHVVRALHVCLLACDVSAVAPEAVVPDYLRGPDVAPATPSPAS